MRISLGEFLSQRLRAPSFKIGLHLLPDDRITPGCTRQAAEKVFHIETGAPGNNGQTALRSTARACLIGKVDKITCRILFPGIADIDEIMRKAVQKIGIGLGGTNVHASIGLHGIGTDDVDALHVALESLLQLRQGAVRASAEKLIQKICLAGRSRPGKYDGVNR